jgi:prolyl-tRNA synthetase
MAETTKAARGAIQPTRAADYPGWYQSVVREADLAEMAHVRGCMVINPWGYGLWEKIQEHLGRMIKELGHENAYFPLFIPLSYIQKEAQHVEGFAKEMAVVTHHRLENRDGTLVPASPLPEPIVVRPTSETIIGESFSSWVKSYRDLPLRINQWCNIVRWEMRPRVFLRTTEFLWQEGHTAHATEAEARAEVLRMLEVYRRFVEDWLAIPVIVGHKPDYDRFPGAVETLALEAMMQDGKALQAGTSHYLGQNFARSADISFVDENNQKAFAHTTSWGMTTRLIGAVIMSHGDDDGLRIPPRIAPVQVVIVPILRGAESDARVLAQAHALRAELSRAEFGEGQRVEAKVDDRDRKPTEKRWQWIKRGAPLQVELGARDLEAGQVTVYARNRSPQEKEAVARAEFVSGVGARLDAMQRQYMTEARARMAAGVRTDIGDFDSLRDFFSSEAFPSGFVRAGWAETEAQDERLKELGVTLRCIPLEQSGKPGRCVLSGRPATAEAIFAKAY